MPGAMEVKKKSFIGGEEEKNYYYDVREHWGWIDIEVKHFTLLLLSAPRKDLASPNTIFVPGIFGFCQSN